jgi:nicotinamide riboside transporter PnuC
MALNATTNGMALSTVSSGTMAILFAGVVFVLILVTLFVLVKNFRRLIYGLSVTVPLALIGWFSWGVAKPASEGNWTPIIWTVSIAGGIMLMIFIGYLLEGIKSFRQIEKKIFEGK